MKDLLEAIAILLIGAVVIPAVVVLATWSFNFFAKLSGIYDD